MNSNEWQGLALFAVLMFTLVPAYLLGKIRQKMLDGRENWDTKERNRDLETKVRCLEMDLETVTGDRDAAVAFIGGDWEPVRTYEVAVQGDHLVSLAPIRVKAVGASGGQG